MLLNCSASSSSSSLVWTSMRWLKSPAPSRRAPVLSAVIGTSMRRANSVPARIATADFGTSGGACQHAAPGIDHIGEGDLADLRVAQKILQEAEIDLGDGDGGGGVGAGMRHRDRHQRALVAEKRWRVADAADDGV